MVETELKQQLSIAFVYAVAARAGFALERIHVDNDSVDVSVCAKGKLDNGSHYHSPMLQLQLKATSQEILKSNNFVFELPVKNYKELSCRSYCHRYLVVFILPSDRQRWLELDEERMISRSSAYYLSLLGSPPTNNSCSVTVRLPRENHFTPNSLRELMVRASRKRRP